MKDDDHIRKLLTNVKSGEKGWRKSLASAEGSFSIKLAEENLRRLEALRQTLLGQLTALETAADNGMIVGDRRRGLSEPQ